MTGWKGRLFCLAGVCLVIGVLLNAGHYFGDARTIKKEADGTPSLRGDFVDLEWKTNSKKRIEIEQRAHSWGDAAIRFGGSFMAAMVIGSLLRMFVKTMAVALIASAVVLAVLYHQGMVDPFWRDALDSPGQARDWIVTQTESVAAFVKGYVPSMTSALLGLGFGLKR